MRMFRNLKFTKGDDGYCPVALEIEADKTEKRLKLFREQYKLSDKWTFHRNRMHPQITA